MARYLVTGGAGFIGSHVVEALVAAGHQVRVVDDLSTGRRSNLAPALSADVMVGDLADAGVAAAAVAGVEHVIHLAAIPSVPRSVRDPASSHRANVDGTHALLLAARNAGVRRVVQASSSSVYGESETLPKHETMAPAPCSPYALHKLIAEQYATLFTDLYGLETVSLRFFNVFGPRQSPSSPYSGVISVFAAALLAGDVPTIYGDGGQTRDFTYVSDVVAATLTACDAPRAPGRIINVAGGARTSITQLYALLQRAIGTGGAARHAAPRPGDIVHSHADITLARELLGYRPAVSIEEGLRRTVAWQRSQTAPGRAHA